MTISRARCHARSSSSRRGRWWSPADLERQIVAAVRDQIGPVAALKEVVIVPGLPKTRSGKILRRTMRGIADGRPESVPSTIEDVRVLDAITPLLKG